MTHVERFWVLRTPGGYYYASRGSTADGFAVAFDATMAARFVDRDAALAVAERHPGLELQRAAVVLEDPEPIGPPALSAAEKIDLEAQLTWLDERIKATSQQVVTWTDAHQKALQERANVLARLGRPA